MNFFLKYLVLILFLSGAATSYAQNVSSGPQTLSTSNLVLLTLVLLLSFIAYRNYHLRKKAEQRADEEKEEIEVLKMRAEKSERYEQQLLANVSHDIRTPMNTVIGMTELTLDTQLTAKQKNYLTAVKKSSENLLVIITDILDRSKQEALKKELDASQFSLRQQIHQVCEAVKDEIENKGLVLQTEIATDIPDLLDGDPSRLTQVLINLCRNAIKHTEKGSIKIVIEKAAGSEATLCFKVVDPGLGIPPHKVGNIFETFHNADPGTWQKYKGSDIGLSIAKTIVELEGGEIDVKNETGVGYEFVFTITYDVAEKKAASILPGIKILVAEDNEYNQVVITDTLETIIEGARVDLAENGKIALEKHSANDYDIILMDVQMPEMSGIEATEIIRKTMEGKKTNIPIIALTAGVMNTELDMCFAAGMNDYIPKPFTRTQLLNTLGRFYKNIQPATEAGNENSSGLVTDLTFLVDFCKDDKVMMKKYIDIYLKVTPGNLEKIKKAADENDYRLMARTVHAMKAHLNYMGMKQTRNLADALELCAKEQNVAELPELIYKLRKDCEQSMDELLSFS